MITPALYQEVTYLADLFKRLFSPSEFIPGCEVKSIADISLYAANNGWIEAICGQHNQQRVRWKSAETVIVGDFIDVIYFPDRRIFEAWGLGGAGAITPPSSGGWPFAKVHTVSATDPEAAYTTIALAHTAASAGDVILVDAETISGSGTITLSKAVILASMGGTVITSSVAGPTIEITADGVKLINLTIRNTGAGAKSGCVKWATDNIVIQDCTLEKLSGASTVSYCLWQLGGSGHIIDTEAECTDPPGSNYGYLNDTADSTVTITRGNFAGLTQDTFTARAGSNIIGEFFAANDVSWAGTGSGWYFDSGNLVAFSGVGITSGVMLQDISESLSIYYPTFALANAAAAAGDTIIISQGGSYACAGETLASGVNLCILPDVVLTGTSQYTLTLAGGNRVFGGGARLRKPAQRRCRRRLFASLVTIA